MSDYYGIDTLEEWLSEELDLAPTPATVALFERWREPIEANIAAWLDSADKNGGYPRSWRDWGRGYAAIPENELADFDKAVDLARKPLWKKLEDSLEVRDGLLTPPNWATVLNIIIEQFRDRRELLESATDVLWWLKNEAEEAENDQT